MEQRLNYVTLAVRDLARSRSFYVDLLGWAEQLYVPGEVLFLPVGEGLVLSLWARQEFAAEVGTPAEGLAPITLAHNVASEAEVDAVLDAAREAGATDVSAGTRRDWGGYSGYFADPDGFRWEVALNPSGEALAAVDATRRWLASRDAPATDQVHGELRRREPLFHREPRSARREHFEAMCAEDLVHVGAGGRMATRAEVIDMATARYESGDHGDDDAWVVEDFAITSVGGDTWMATYLLHQGTRLSRRCTLWSWRDERWQVRYHQGTLTG